MTDPLPLSAPRHRRLVDAAVAEFASAGYDGASLNRIIRAAGMSKSSFYHFVASKAELFDAVVRLLLADIAQRWHPPTPGAFATDFWGEADAVLADLARLSADDDALRALGRLFYLDAPAATPTDARMRLLDDVRVWVRGVIRVGAGSGAVRTDIPAELLADTTFAVLRAVDEWAVGGAGAGDPSVDERAARIPGLLLRSLLTAQES
ncbi:TetR family transcriptional regulator [Microbacterium pseudoresistens]|uniref:AcrR family transcriptional regulator n=1 Tax=Microbacterium pseudoresistens TaxID=640634 RepID=A0A7Y9EUI6_9MICO|nr:AcrR family transcriptional regulator [Microbacterium pseudoresistens]